MLPPVLLPAAIFALLFRYPKQTIIIVCALLGVFISLAMVVALQQNKTEQALNKLLLTIEYQPAQCGKQTPLAVTLHNTSKHDLTQLSWTIAAYRPNSNLNVAQNIYPTPSYSAGHALAPNNQWTSCSEVPPLRTGYSAPSLVFKAENLNGKFL